MTGLLTAVSCARAGHRVTVVERGPIPNPVSSSFDQQRAIRALDPGDVAATRTVAGLHRRWLELEATPAEWASKGTGPRYAKFGRHVRYLLSDVIDWERKQFTQVTLPDYHGSMIARLDGVNKAADTGQGK